MQSIAPILITGGVQRVGLHCARRLLESGQPVIVTYRTEREGIDQLRSLGATVLSADLSNEASIDAFISRLRQSTNRLRCIVHNASEWLTETTGDEAGRFTKLFAVHMLAPYLINLRCEDLLHYGGPADIVHMSDAATDYASLNHTAYLATKAGLDSLTLSFAKRYAPRIKVNGIAPELVMLDADSDSQLREHAIASCPLSLVPGPEVDLSDVALRARQPLSPGVTVPVDGGRYL